MRHDARDRIINETEAAMVAKVIMNNARRNWVFHYYLFQERKKAELIQTKFS